MNAIGLVAFTYIYFLLFAQFAFLHGIRAAGYSTASIHLVLGAMAASGVIGSLVAARLMAAHGATRIMGGGMAVCAAAGLVSSMLFSRTVPASVPSLIVVSASTGLGLALVTVAVATDLRRLVRGRAPALHAGIGTGLAYLFCNLPPVFAATPSQQSCIAACAAGLGFGLVFLPVRGPARAGRASIVSGWFSVKGIATATVLFLALVWFDSAAFAVVQLDPSLRDRFWGDTATLLTNGGVSAAAAVMAGGFLDHGWFKAVLVGALGALIAGSIGFRSDAFAGILAASIYSLGVAFYSTALTAFAGLGAHAAGQPHPAWRAAWIYALAGWCGSTAGVGLAEQGGTLPPWAAPAAALVFAGGLIASLTFRHERLCEGVA